MTRDCLSIVPSLGEDAQLRVAISLPRAEHYMSRAVFWPRGARAQWGWRLDRSADACIRQMAPRITIAMRLGVCFLRELQTMLSEGGGGY